MSDQFEAHAREIACAANGYCYGPVDSDGHGLGCNETYAAILAVLRSAVEAERQEARAIITGLLDFPSSPSWLQRARLFLTVKEKIDV